MPKVDLDKFYTKDSIARECVSLLGSLDFYDTIVEPSAGSGAFSSLIPNCLAFDIEPESESITKQDFFELNLVSGDNILFVGNPPFGTRSTLAKGFIKHSMKLNARTIAFILPNTFSKVSNQGLSLFPKEWSLVIEEPLQSDSFLIDGEEYHVPCSFYVWVRGNPGEVNPSWDELPNLRKVKVAQPVDFKFMPRGSIEADFSVNGNNGKVKDLASITNPKAEHYIRVTNRDTQSIEKLRSMFSQFTYDFKSSVNGGNAWVGQQEIIKAFLEDEVK